MADIALAGYGSPSVCAYPWSSGFGTKYSNPGTSVSGNAFSSDFHVSGNAVGFAHGNSPYASAYEWTSSGFGSRLTNPSLPSLGYRIKFSADGNDAFVTTNNSPYISAFPFTVSGGFGTKYSNPATLPPFGARGVDIDGTSSNIAVGHQDTPASAFVSAYPWTSGSGFGTKYSDPASPPPALPEGVSFTSTGNAVALAHGTSPYVSAYPFSGSGFGTKYSNPGTLPASGGRRIRFSPDDNNIAVVHATSPYVTAYPWSSGFGTKYSNPGTLPAGSANGLDFSVDGNDIAIGHSSSPYVTAYPWSSGFGTKYSNPGSLPAGTIEGVAFGIGAQSARRIFSIT